MATYTDQLVVLNSGIITKIAASDIIEIGGDFTVGGNLTVNGTTTTINSEVQTADDFILLNSEYTADPAKAGGIIWNIDPDTTTFSLAGGAFAGANTIEVNADPSSLSTGDIILVQGAADPANNGLFEVNSISGVVPFTITTEATPTADLGLQNTFVVDSTVQGTVVKVSVTYLRAKSTGGLETATGDNAGTISFSDLATSAGSTLQAAYDAGATITTNGPNIAFGLASGDFILEGPGDANLGLTGPALGTFGVIAGVVSLNAAAASNFTVDAGNLTLSTTTSGVIDVTSAGAMDINATDAVTIDSTGAGISLDAAGASNFTTSAGALTLTSAAAATWSTAAGALTLDGASGVNIAGNASQVDITTTGAVDINGGGVTVDAAFQMVLTATTGMILDTAGGSGLEINASSGPINIGNDTVAQPINIGTSGNRTVTIGNSTLNTTLDLNGGSGGIDADTIGQVNLDSSQAAATAIVLNASNAAGGIDVDAGTGGIDITTTGDMATTVASSSATAWSVDDGSNSYLTVDSVANRTVVGQFLDGGVAVGHGTEYINNTGSAISAGTLVAVDTNTALQIIEADATSGSATNLTCRILGVTAEDIDAPSGSSGKISTVHGTAVLVRFSAAHLSSQRGQVAYLDASGQATLTAPSSPGEFVVEVGIVQSATSGGSNLARVLFMPRFVAAL